jgi:hypothetical protein
VPVVHWPVPFGIVHSLPQPPQSLIVLRLVSQPVAAILSQSSYPPLQVAMPQLPPTHAAVALLSMQAMPQAPQLSLLDERLTSQPSEALVLQSP